jgi:hypothetical protein
LFRTFLVNRLKEPGPCGGGRIGVVEEYRGELSIESGMVATVDPVAVDAFLAGNSSLIDGEVAMQGVAQVAAGGLICATGGDGIFPIAMTVDHGAITSFTVTFSDQEQPSSKWAAAGTIAVPSGAALIGDPGVLRQYVPDPFEPPYEVFGVWAVLRLPKPGLLKAQLIADRAAFGVVKMRCVWQCFDA